MRWKALRYLGAGARIAMGVSTDLLYSLPALVLNLTLGNALAGLGRLGIHPFRKLSFTRFEFYSEPGMDGPVLTVKGGLMDGLGPFARAITTGRYVQFYRKDAFSDPAVRRHEIHGHALAQCRYLGPLYLPLVLLDYAVTLQWLLPVWPGVKDWSLVEKWANHFGGKPK